MIKRYYTCPKRDTYSGYMPLSTTEFHKPNDHELKTRMWVQCCATEVLECPCREKNTWFTLQIRMDK